MIYNIFYYLPYLLIGVFYYYSIKSRKELVKQLEEKEEITKEDEMDLKMFLIKEYGTLIFGIFVISHELYYSLF